MTDSRVFKKLSEEDAQMLQALLTSKLSSRKVVKKLKNLVSKSTVNNLRKLLREEGEVKSKGPRIMLLDIETTPEISFTWGRWKQFISQEQIIEHPYVLTWAIRWLDTGETISRKLTDYPSFQRNNKDDAMLIFELWDLMMEADFVVAHNGDKFDIPWILSRAIKFGLPPLNPTKFIDTLKFAKKHLRLPSNSLKSIAAYYDLRPKLDNAGFPLWRSCMEGDAQAFLDMETYNVGDLDTLEDVYLLFRPYMRNHPNAALYFQDDYARCSRCGSTNLHEEETHYHTSISSFGTVRCGDCGAVHRTRKNVRTKEQMANTLVAV